MSLEQLRQLAGFEKSGIRLEGFTKDFFDAMALMWSGALKKNLTAEDVVTLLACPFAAGNVAEYAIKMGMEPTGIYIAVDVQEKKDN